MYCYKITNLINNKQYIGITIDATRRFKQHCNMLSNSLIHKAIVKYGKENFSFEILKEGCSLEEAEEMEIRLIKEFNTLAPNGYNLAKGGMYGGSSYKVSDEDVAFIKNNRNQPMYVLYDIFSDKISYGYFKELYHHKTRLDIVPSVEEYPHNLEFSCQFTKSNMTYCDILEIRKAYGGSIHWKDLYKKYQDKVAESTFWEIYTGRNFSLIMPEVFTDENKAKRTSLCHSGERNSNAKLKKEDVIQIRYLFNTEKKTNREIHAFYPQVSLATIQDITRGRTWKNV